MGTRSFLQTACVAWHLCSLSHVVQAAVSFTPGNIVVLAAGSSSSPITPGQSASASLLELDPTGILVQTVAMPVIQQGNNAPFSLSTDDNYAGALSVSDDGRYFLFGGFATPPGTPNPDLTNSTVLGRAIASVRVLGAVVDTSTSLTTGVFSGDGGSKGGGIRCVASDNGLDVFVAGYDQTAGPSVVIVNGSGAGAGTIGIAPGEELSSCTVYDSRLLGVRVSGSIVAIEDLHSVEPGLPDALFDPAFAPTVRTLTDGVHDGTGAALTFVGHGGGSTIYQADAVNCLTQWSFNDNTPTDYVLDSGYLDAGLDLLPGPDFCLALTLPQAKAQCTANPTCAGFTFFYNASLGPSPTPPGGPAPGPYSPSMAIWTFLKGPFFYYTQTDTGLDWITYQKPATSGNFNFLWQSTAATPCTSIGTGSFGLFAVAADSNTPSTLYGTTDDGTTVLAYNTGSGTASILATAPSGTIYRGIAVVPGPPLPTPTASARPGPPTAPPGGGSPSGSVAAGVLIPLFLLAAVGGYLFIYHKERTLSALAQVTQGGKRGFLSLGASGGESKSLLGGTYSSSSSSLPRPGATSMPHGSLTPNPDHIKARSRTLSAVGATASPPGGKSPLGKIYQADP